MENETRASRRYLVGKARQINSLVVVLMGPHVGEHLLVLGGHSV